MNGGITSIEAYQDIVGLLEKNHLRVGGIMIARGLLANPSLLTAIKFNDRTRLCPICESILRLLDYAQDSNTLEHFVTSS